MFVRARKKRVPFPLRLLPDEEGRKPSTFSLPTLTKSTFAKLPRHISSPFTRGQASHRLSMMA